MNKNFKKVYIENKEVSFKDLGQPVMYIPNHAEGNPNHPDTEMGFISTVRDGSIWVRFTTGDTGSLCNSENLRWM